MEAHKEQTTRTRNYLHNITPHLYSYVNPQPEAHTFLIVDSSEGECIAEFHTFEELQNYCISNFYGEQGESESQVIAYAIVMHTLQ